jgi:hypothetical protein
LPRAPGWVSIAIEMRTPAEDLTVTDTQEPEATARGVFDSIMYMTLATADAEGRPWASPVWYARSSPTELLWASDPDARHSRNLAARPEIAVVIFDSTVPVGSAAALYLEAIAGQLGGSDLERAIKTYSQRSQEVGAPAWTVADVSPPARFRLYRATVTAISVLGQGDQRIPVRPTDKETS